MYFENKNSLEKFVLTKKVDLLRWGQVYFEIYVNDKLEKKLDNNGRYWNVLLDREINIDYTFSYDISDRTTDVILISQL